MEYRVRMNYPQIGEYVEYLYNQIKPIVDESASGIEENASIALS